MTGKRTRESTYVESNKRARRQDSIPGFDALPSGMDDEIIDYTEYNRSSENCTRGRMLLQ